MGKYLNAESILAAEDFKYAEVECPEWGGTVRVRSLSGGQRAQITQRVNDKQLDELDELLAVMACVDEDGSRIFTNKDIASLKKKSAAVVTRIAKKVLEISGIGNEAGEVDEAKKNSELTASDDSSLD
jgi:hypothetical protein